MRIINKEFHDYYDNCMSYGLDKSIIYDRKQIELSNNLPDENRLLDKSKKFSINIPTRKYSSSNCISETIHFSERPDITFNSCFIGFCGYIYPFLNVYTTKWDCCHHADVEDFIYDFESYQQYIKSKKIKKNDILLNMKAMEKYFNVFEETDFFFDIKNPIFVNTPLLISHDTYWNSARKLIINPCLSDYKFYRKIDAMTAFQKISMFLSGVLGGVHPSLLEVSDEIKKHKHGFGHKYAFKKEPSKRKRK